MNDLLNRAAIPPKEIHRLLRKMTDQGEILIVDAEKMKVIDIRPYQQLKEMVQAQLKEFHQKFPMRSGLAKEELRTKLPAELDVKLFQTLLNELIHLKEVVMEKDKLRLPSHQIASADEKGLMKRVEEAMRKGDLQPASSKELAEQWSEKEEEVQAILEHLVHGGTLVKIKSGMYFHRDAIERLKGVLIQYLKEHQEITTPQFKEMTGVSRKFTIPLIEYFDQARLTLRLGEKRGLRAGAQGADRKNE